MNNVRLFIFTFLIFCIHLPAFSQQNSPKTHRDDLELDSLLSLLKGEIYAVYTTHNFEELYEAAQKALTRAQREGSASQKADAHDNLAIWHMKKELPARNDSMLYHDLKILGYYEEMGDLKKIADACINVATDYMAKDPHISEEYIMKSLKVSEDLEDKDGIASAYYKLSVLNKDFEEYELSTQQSEKAIKLYEELNDTIWSSISLYHSIESYLKLKKSDIALAHGNRAVSLSESYSEQDPTVLMRAYSWRSEAFREKGDYELALKDAIKGWEICKTLVEDEREADGFKESIAHIYFDQKRCKEAIAYYQDYIAHSKRRGGVDKRMVAILKKVSTCYEKEGNYEKALEYQVQSIALSDSLKDKKYASLKGELQIKYETDKKEQIIEQQSLERKYSFLTIGFLAALILISIWAYRRLNTLNGKLKKTNDTNELLLKEIHHRVKNNLQTISSLLNLQSNHIEDAHIQEAVKNSQSRVGSMALIHQKLYQGENLAAVEIKEYLRNLGESIIHTFDIDTAQIEIDYQMPEMEVDVDTAIPLGLIANELLTNSLKYAFPEQQRGRISVSLEKVAGEKLSFKVSDNGVGLSSDNKKPGFGSQLIKLLAKQMRASIHTVNDGGFSTEIQFRLS